MERSSHFSQFLNCWTFCIHYFIYSSQMKKPRESTWLVQVHPYPCSFFYSPCCFHGISFHSLLGGILFLLLMKCDNEIILLSTQSFPMAASKSNWDTLFCIFYQCSARENIVINPGGNEELRLLGPLVLQYLSRLLRMICNYTVNYTCSYVRALLSHVYLHLPSLNAPQGDST